VLLGDGNRSKIQYYNTSFDVDWQMHYRSGLISIYILLFLSFFKKFNFDIFWFWWLHIYIEIIWKSSCRSGSLSGLQNNMNPLAEMTYLQLILVIFNGVFGLGILGIIFPVLEIYQIVFSMFIYTQIVCFFFLYMCSFVEKIDVRVLWWYTLGTPQLETEWNVFQWNSMEY